MADSGGSLDSAAVAWWSSPYKLWPVIILTSIVLYGSLHLVDLVSEWWNRKTVIIVGSSKVGKTTLFLKLIAKDTSSYVPTLHSRRALYKVSTGWTSYVQLVDLPGDPSLVHCTEQWMRKADAVILVVDGAAYREKSLDTTKKLHMIIQHELAQRKKCTPTLIVVNKVDLESKVQGLQFIKHNLQCELDHAGLQIALEESAQCSAFDRLSGALLFGSMSAKLDQYNAVKRFLEKLHAEDPSMKRK